MQLFKYKKVTQLVATFILMSVGALGSAYASPVPIQLTYDFTTGGSVDTSNAIGNTWSFDPIGYTAADGYTITITSWTVHDAGMFEKSAGIHVGTESGNTTLGLGVCNRQEKGKKGKKGAADTECKDEKNQRAVDNKGKKGKKGQPDSVEQDWLLITLPELMTIEGFTVTPEQEKKRSVSYYTGLISDTDIEGLTYAALAAEGFDTVINENFAKSLEAQLVSVTDVGFRNALLIGASTIDADAAFTLTNFTASAVPVPPAVWLFGSGLATLGWMRRKKSLIKEDEQADS
jgi:hypothetical protein